MSDVKCVNSIRVCISLVEFERMASGKKIDDLPNEILLKVFTHLSIGELAMSVQYVSVRWREVSQDDKLWRSAVFSPHKEVTDEEIVKYLENMPALRSYSSKRKTSNIVIDTMCECCRNMKSIELHHSHVMKVSLMQKIVQNFPKIKSLKIVLPYPDQLKVAELIGQCQSLESLSLGEYYQHRTLVYGGALVLIAEGCPSLQHVHLGDCLVNECIEYFIRRKRHKLLSFSCKIFVTKGISEHISECTKLQHLDIENRNDGLLYDDIQCLIKMTHLKYFAFRFCSEDVMKNLPTFFTSGSFSQLVHLDLSESYYISDTLMKSVFENCPHLRHLNISGGQSLHNDGLSSIGRCIQLEHLDLSVCMDLTDGSMEYVGAGCQNLKKLDISACYKMTDKAIEYIVQCRKLKVLKFNYNDLTGSNFHLISTHLQHLGELHLENCMYLNELYIDELHKKMAHLKIIVARRCKEPYLDPEEAVLLLD